MPIGAAIGAAAPIVGGAIGKAIGGGGPKNAQSATPKDLQPMRQSNIGLLNYLLGFNQPNAPWGQPQQQPASQGGPMQRGQQPGIGQGGMPWQVGGAGQMGGGSPFGPSMDPHGMQAAFGQMYGQGMGGMGGMAGGMLGGQGGGMATGGPVGQGVPFSGGKQGGNQMLGMPNAQQPMAWASGQPQGGPTGGLDRIESYFGQLGTPTTALQQQSLGGISQFLNSNPYGQSNNALQQIMGPGHDYFGGASNAFKNVGNANYFGDAKNAFQGIQGFNPFQPAQQSLEGMLGQNPGQGMLEALRPQFDRNMAAANQQGGRFGSANAILRSRAVDDYNLLGAQALQRGIDQQIAAAGQYGVLGNNLINARLGAGQGLLGVGQGQLSQGLGAAQGQLGVGQGRSGYDLGLRSNQLGAASQMAQNQNAMFGNLTGGYNVGSQQAQQEAQRQQQAIQILSGLLGTSQSASLGGPTVVQPTGAQQGAQMGAGMAPWLAMLGGGGGGGSPFVNPGRAQSSFGIPYGLG